MLPLFLRWTDYLTGRSCVLRTADEDSDLTLRQLTGLYLEVEDVGPLVAGNRLLPEDLEAFETLRDLVLLLEDDGYPGPLHPKTVLRDGPHALDAGAPPPWIPATLGGTDVQLVDVLIDRSECDYSRNWTGFNRRRWERNEPLFRSFVDAALSDEYDSQGALQPLLGTKEGRLEFLHRVARAIWDSPFENYSRFSGPKLPYKTGDETILNIIEGRGGICSEKVQALRFIADAYGFDPGYVFAGPDAIGPLPTERLRHVLESFDFHGAQDAMRFWQHLALEFRLDEEPLLVDATNGNIPFLFERGSRCSEILNDQRPLPVRMATYDEEFYYHRAPDDLGEGLCYAMESFIPEIDLVQVFDNELGLTITPEFLVSPAPFRDDEEFDGLVELYGNLAGPNSLEFEVRAEWNLDGRIGLRFQESDPEAAGYVLDCYDHLLARYRRFEGGSPEMGLAVIQLRELV